MTPDEHTIKEFFIDVGDGHQLYVYEWGDPKGMPIIFIHGGPGGEIKDSQKGYINPTKHRVVYFDQRGCGKSLPYGSIEHNTTNDTLNDITKIADHLKLKQFTLYAQSWGATLALAYGIKHPKRVQAMVLGSVFTASQREIDWIDKGDFELFFPEVWEEFLRRTPKAHHKNPAAYHYKSILEGNEELAQTSALAIAEMERKISSLDDRVSPIDPTTFDPTYTRVFTHYFKNNCFLPDRYIINNAHKLTMPVWMVHGRYDISCPPITAYELHKAMPNSHLTWVISSHRNEHENTSVLRTILLNLAEK